MLYMIGLAEIFLFTFVSVLLCVFISRKFLRSGNNVNTKYLNRNLKPEYLTGVNVPNLQDENDFTTSTNSN